MQGSPGTSWTTVLIWLKFTGMEGMNWGVAREPFSHYCTRTGNKSEQFGSPEKCEMLKLAGKWQAGGKIKGQKSALRIRVQVPPLSLHVLNHGGCPWLNPILEVVGRALLSSRILSWDSHRRPALEDLLCFMITLPHASHWGWTYMHGPPWWLGELKQCFRIFYYCCLLF